MLVYINEHIIKYNQSYAIEFGGIIMENNNSLEAFNSMPVSKAVIKNAIPAMIAMLMVLIYNLADTFFIGQTHDAYQVAAVSLATPVFLMFMAVGQANKAMMGQLIGNFLNIILDPIMILGFGWNIKGAAIATVIGNLAAAAYYILYFIRGKSSLSININDFSIKDKICSGVLIIGIPASLASVMMSISQIIMNGLMAGYGDMALAGIGVAMKVTMITGMISMGIGQGVQPLLGYCVGANTWDRFKKIMKFSLIFSFLLGLILTVLCYLFTNSIVSAFLTEPSAFDYSVQFSRILLTTSTFFGVFYVLTNALQAMGAAVSSLIINLSRQGLIYSCIIYFKRSFRNNRSCMVTACSRYFIYFDSNSFIFMGI